MAVNIDKVIAEKNLLAAFRTRCTKSDEVIRMISKILNGTHKTYKYILITGLLAKSTNNSANPISLQSGADIDGAYDARSLCHNVVVPFERDFLSNALGGSNEPFLNKPARFTHLSIYNAVRAGNDRETLEILIKVLSSLESASEALNYLGCALAIVGKRVEELKTLNDSSIVYNPTIIEIYEFIIRFIEKSFEGESCAIIIASLEKIYYNKLKKHYKVIAHKVNQSGASSKEIGDIDIYREDKFIYSIEVKDKTFSEYDLEHAFNKVMAAGGEKAEFIFGPNCLQFDKVAITKKLKEFGEKGLFTILHSIYAYSRIMLFKIDLTSKNEFVEALFESAKEINAKDLTRKWIQDLLIELTWK